VAVRRGVVVLFLCGLPAAGCGDDPGAELDVDTPATLVVTSAAFGEGEDIPVRFTCDGEETSPPLAWSGRSTDSGAWALVVDDPDAPGDTFVHWVVLDIPRTTRSVDPGSVPAGAVEAVNSAGTTTYAGPCPPSGEHHYRFTVYALSTPTGLAEGAGLDDALEAIGSAAVASGTLQGVYTRGS